MDYKKNIDLKSRILLISLLISGVVRVILDIIFNITIKDMYILGCLTAPLLIIDFVLMYKKASIATMYYNVFMFIVSIGIMISFDQSMANYIMIFFGFIMISVYQDFKAIVLDALGSCALLIYFFIKCKATLFANYNYDTLVFFVAFIAMGAAVLASSAKMTAELYKQSEKSTKEIIERKNKTEKQVNKLCKSIESLVKANSVISEEISSTSSVSEEISSAVNNVSERATNQVGVVTDIKSVLSVGNDKIGKVADNIKTLKNFADSTAAVVNEGSSKVDNLSKEMINVKNNINDAVMLINELNEENTKILQIISTINGISEQTNLLALNASIEAARAGEYGKGFAVVADEVRKLAEDSQSSTNSVEEILNSITSKTKKVAEKIIEEQESIKTCSEHTSDVQNIFNNINENTSNVLSHSSVINDESMELNSSMNHTVDSINTISDNVETTASSVQEIASSIDELNNSISNIALSYDEISRICEELNSIH